MYFAWRWVYVILMNYLVYIITNRKFVKPLACTAIYNIIIVLNLVQPYLAREHSEEKWRETIECSFFQIDCNVLDETNVGDA